MKLGPKDCLEEVYYTQNSADYTILYKEKEINLNSLKAGRRDTKGTRIRV